MSYKEIACFSQNLLEATEVSISSFHYTVISKGLWKMHKFKGNKPYNYSKQKEFGKKG
uniref:Uncharacterized protein n=1 Tax=Anguilla anguilla TaxID=7936 RepID=A0A0E9WAT7_ANGAN